MRTTEAKGAFRVATQRRSVTRWRKSASRSVQNKGSGQCGVMQVCQRPHVLPAFATQTPVLKYNLHGVVSQYQRCDKCICRADNWTWVFGRTFDSNMPSVAYPGILFWGGGSTNSVEDRGQRERRSGAGSPLVRCSGGSCNLVPEI